MDTNSTNTQNLNGIDERPPISFAKLMANRANAKHSTGAKTQAGHEASSMNALRHGLTSSKAFLPGDSKEAYQQLIDSYHERYTPATAEETELVQIIAENAWRILKVAPEEAAAYEIGRLQYGDNLFTEEKDPERRLGLINAQVGMLYEKHLRNLRLHERRLRKQQDRDIAALKQMQTDRVEKAARHIQESIDSLEQTLTRAHRVVEKCAEHNMPCDLEDFGFDFTLSEWKHFHTVNNIYSDITGESLDFYLVVNEHRDAQKTSEQR